MTRSREASLLYNNVGPYLAGILVQRRAGCDLTEYLMPRLFGPLGIWRPTWECDPLGNTFGAGGLMLTLSELHRFGLLYLNEGMWNGQQLISREWVKESTQQQYSAPYAIYSGGESLIRSGQTGNTASCP